MYIASPVAVFGSFRLSEPALTGESARVLHKRAVTSPSDPRHFVPKPFHPSFWNFAPTFVRISTAAIRKLFANLDFSTGGRRLLHYMVSAVGIETEMSPAHYPIALTVSTIMQGFYADDATCLAGSTAALAKQDLVH